MIPVLPAYPPTRVRVEFQRVTGFPTQSPFPLGIPVAETRRDASVVEYGGILKDEDQEKTVMGVVRRVNEAANPPYFAIVSFTFDEKYLDLVDRVIPAYAASLMEFSSAQSLIGPGEGGSGATQCRVVCETKPTICPKDVRECPDGSFVGRQGPDCSFPPCPPVYGYGYYGAGGSEKVLKVWK